MKNAKRVPLLSTLVFLSLAACFSGCATIAPCPGSLMPIVEVQVNDTASNHDDYGSTTTSTVARARITNPNRFGGGRNFPSGVAVEIRNPLGSSNLGFASTSGGSPSASLFQTLPEDGGWSTFFVRGTATSTVDKSAIVEVATAGACPEAVVARKAMMIPSGALPIPGSPARPRVEIEIGSVATLDDYIAWSPVSSRIRWADGTPGGTLDVTLRNMAGGDRLRFAPSTLAGGQTATNATLPLTLTGDGAWVRFFVAGNFASPSTADKDAVLEVTEGPRGALLSRDGLMVRIRKNANNLTTAERDRYLQALQKVSATYVDYIEFVRTHSRSTGTPFSLVSHRQAHNGSAFLPWHRAFVLHLERIIQAADPAVALHYWKFDSPAPNVFNAAFLGSNSSGNFATLGASNPIVSWTLPGEGVGTGIQRNTPYGDSGNPALASDTTVLGLGGAGFNYAGFIAMEVSAHNPAHFRSGFFDPATGQPLPGASWVGGSPAIAPRDPIFFFLHSNVDRLWGRWQWLRDRSDPSAVATYDLQGTHAAPAAGVDAPAFTQNAFGQITANRTLGHYAGDSMWPWDNVLGGTGTSGRPDIAILTPFPIVLGGLLPLGRPTVANVIDYAGVSSTAPHSGMGFGYDDFNPFQ